MTRTGTVNRCRKQEYYVVRYCQYPLDQGKPTVEVLLNVRTVDFEMHRLLVDSRRILVCEQDEVRIDPARKACPLACEIEPPPRISAPEYDHQCRCQRKVAGTECHPRGPLGPVLEVNLWRQRPV